MDQAAKAEKIAALREALANNSEFTSCKETDITGDFRLLRFLMARSYDLEKAKVMVEDHLTWRRENKLGDIRSLVQDKPFFVENFPNTAELKAIGLGMVGSVVNGGLSRQGEVVHIELVGGGGGGNLVIPEGKDDEFIEKLYQHYIGFFERRSIYLEDLSIQENRLVRCVQIRDVSTLSLIPKGGVFAIIRKILKSGIDNYPETASLIFFVNPPAIFYVLYPIVKRLLPEETKKKIRFISGEDIVAQMLPFLYPRTIVGWQRLTQGEYGDAIAKDLAAAPPANSSRVIEKFVSARYSEEVFFAMSASATTTISWERLDTGSPKSKVWARLYYVSNPESTVPDDIKVETEDFVDVASVTLPLKINEAVLVIFLDHTASWFQGHTFNVRVVASGSESSSLVVQ